MEMTANALGVLKRMGQAENSAITGFRITLLPSGVSPQIEFSAIDTPETNDKVVSVEGIAFCMDPATATHLSGYTIEHGINGFKLVFMPTQGRCSR